MYLTYLYLRSNLKDLPELVRLDFQYPLENGVKSFLSELTDCIKADITRKLDSMSKPLLDWFLEEKYLIVRN